VSDRKRFKPGETAPPAERRRLGTVVHDERGNASVEWRDAPADHERPVLEVLGEDGLTLKSEEVSYDPYARTRPGKGGSGRRTDLRKLSEWIKQMRDLEQRKRNGGNGDGE
jgi:hypothetical protein